VGYNWLRQYLAPEFVFIYDFSYTCGYRFLRQYSKGITGIRMSKNRSAYVKFQWIRKLFSGAGLFVILTLIGIGLIAYLSAGRQLAGEEIAIMSNTTHIPEGMDPNPYNSNPPTSGVHYDEDLKAGFYAENRYTYPEGYLVHNLEHGYIIFWYNCDLLSNADCDHLKSQISAVMDERENFKLIAYPWEKTDVALVLTSWGRRLDLVPFERAAALDFIDRNLNQAPEPQAD